MNLRVFENSREYVLSCSFFVSCLALCIILLRVMYFISNLYITIPISFFVAPTLKTLLALISPGLYSPSYGHFGALERKCYKTMMSTIRTCAPAWGWVRTIPFGPKNACACKLVAASRALTHELRVPGRNATTMIVDDDRRRRHSDIDLFMSSNSLSQLVFQQIPT